MAKEIVLTAREMRTTTINLRYQRILFNRCMSIFKWKCDKLDNVFFMELEKRLLFYGYCGVYKDDNGVWAVEGSMSGVTPYNDIFEKFTFGNPILKGGSYNYPSEKMLVCYNNYLRESFYRDYIQPYAFLLAHAYVTSKVNLVNARMCDLLVAKDASQRDSLNEYRNKILEGDSKTIIDEGLFPSETSSMIVPTTNRKLSEEALENWNLRNEIFRSFCEDIGLRYVREKGERLITSEVNGNDELLANNLESMLNCRKKFCDDLKEWFGIDCTVELNRNYVNTSESNEESTEGNEVENES